MEKRQPKDPLRSPEAKELQKFFSKVKHALLLPKRADGEGKTSGVGLLFDKETYDNFILYGLKKTIQELFAGKFPILIISVRDGTAFAGIAIRDMSSPLRFIFPDQPVGATLYKFMEVTPDGAAIELTMGFLHDGEISFDPEPETHHLLMLSGYYFDNVP